MRAGATGQWRGARFELTVDPQDVDGTLVKDAYVEFRPGSYEIRFGQFKPPGSRDYGTSARQTDFLERTALGGSLSAQRDLGVSLHGDIGQHVDYDVGVFAGDNNGDIQSVRTYRCRPPGVGASRGSRSGGVRKRRPPQRGRDRSGERIGRAAVVGLSLL